MAILTTIRNYLDMQQEITLTYIRGSCSGGVAMPSSDYDLVIVTKQALMPERRTQIEKELSDLLDGDMVVLSPLNHAPTKRSYAIVMQRQLVFEQDLSHRVTFELGLMTGYSTMIDSLQYKEGVPCPSQEGMRMSVQMPGIETHPEQSTPCPDTHTNVGT